MQMKTKILSCILTLIGVSVLNAQQFPFLTDPGSLAGSGAALALYKRLDDEDKKNRDKMKAFGVDYIKRQVYFMGFSLAVGERITNEIEASVTRYNSLKNRNSSLSLLNYSKKKENTKMLALIETMLNNIQREARNQKGVFVIYGEKMNLLQNMMESLEEINRVLDVVEDNIEQTKLYNRIFN